jgi:hypothetical protein
LPASLDSFCFFGSLSKKKKNQEGERRMKKITVLLLVGFLLFGSDVLAGRYIFPWAELKDQIEEAGYQAEYGLFGGETLYLKVVAPPMTVAEFCESVPFLKKDLGHSVEKIRGFQKIGDPEIKLKVFLIPIN